MGSQAGDWLFRPTPEDGTEEAVAWTRAMALIGTVGDDELTDPNLSSEQLLYRLFHEDGVRVYQATNVTFACRCGPERVRNVLSGFAPEELSDMLIDGKIEVTCEFCSSRYLFSPDELEPSA